MECKYLVNGKPSYYSIDSDDKKYLLGFISKFEGLNRGQMKKVIYEIVNDSECIYLLTKYYRDRQIGIKSLCKLLDSAVGYTTLRGIIKKLGILSTGSSHEFTEEQRKMRKHNAVTKITPTGFPSVYTHQHLLYNSNKQGIQGFYFSKCMNEFIWLRSTYEYIVADYLDSNNILYVYETFEYVLNDGRRYRPDFHILNESGMITMIIEIKSDYYLSHQDDKAILLNEDLKNVFLIFGVDGICNFFNITERPSKLYGIKIGEWKAKRRTYDEIKQS